MAGGSHKRWVHERPDDAVEVTELHRYAASPELVLRHIGRALAEATAGVVPTPAGVPPEAGSP